MKRFEMARAQRELMGISQKRLAELAGVPQTSISQYENGNLASLDEERVEAIHNALTSTRDRLYPEKSYERQVYLMKLHTKLFEYSETFNDKMEYLNKVVRDVTFLEQYVMEDKKRNDSETRNQAWRRGYRY